MSVADSELRPAPGEEMISPDTMGVFDDANLLGSDEQLAGAFARLESDPRFDRSELERRLAERAQREQQQSPAMPSVEESKEKPAQPDVIMFGFCKIAFNFVEALKQRFPRRRMIAKTYEVFWQIAEQAPAMPYEEFRKLVFNVGEQVAADEIAAGDTRLARKVDKLKRQTAGTVGDEATEAAESEEAKKAREQLRQLFANKTLAIFDQREAERKKLPADETQVADADNCRLFADFEARLRMHLIEIPLFKLAKMDRVWCDRLDLRTRDTVMQYMHRLCKVTDLINNFDPTMKDLINSVSLDSLAAVQGKSKNQVDYNALLDELQERVLNNPEFLDKACEIAMKQTDD